MARGLKTREEENRRGGGLKQNLALPGESNRRNVQTGIGQIQDQKSPIISGKALEQPTIKKTTGEGIGGILKRSIGRVGRAIREEGLDPSRIATSILTEKTPTIEDRGIKRGIGVETKKTEPRQIGTSILTEEGGVSKLVGRGLAPKTKGTIPPGDDFTRGTPTEVRVAREAKARAERKTGRGARGLSRGGPFNILNLEGIQNVISSAGELAAFFASPGFQAQQRRTRGKIATRKAKIENLKSIDGSIKAISSALEGVAFGGGTPELKDKLTGQLQTLLQQRESVSVGAKPGPSGLNLTTPEDTLNTLSKAGFEKDEALNITRRVHGS